MATKTTKVRSLIALTLVAVWPLLGSCDADPAGPAVTLPHPIWADGCAELAPYQNGYRINGICCTSILLPAIALNRDRQFSVDAEYHTFTGAGVANYPIVITGQLSDDGQTLTITYTINSVPTTHVFKPGRAIVACDCYCN